MNDHDAKEMFAKAVWEACFQRRMVQGVAWPIAWADQIGAFLRTEFPLVGPPAAIPGYRPPRFSRRFIAVERLAVQDGSVRCWRKEKESEGAVSWVKGWSHADHESEAQDQAKAAEGEIEKFEPTSAEWQWYDAYKGWVRSEFQEHTALHYLTDWYSRYDPDDEFASNPYESKRLAEHLRDCEGMTDPVFQCLDRSGRTIDVFISECDSRTRFNSNTRRNYNLVGHLLAARDAVEFGFEWGDVVTAIQALDDQGGTQA